MHDIRYDAVRDEIYVTNPFAQAILTFRGDADGEASPIRIIQGSKTHLGKVDTLEIDVVNNEFIVPMREEILVFPLDGNGNVAPLRILRGNRHGWRSGGGVAVDPIHNVLVTDGRVIESGEQRTDYRGSRSAILIFNRTDKGEVKPLRVIRGPKTGIQAIRQMQIYPPKGMIIISQITDGGIPEPDDTFVGVWSIYDDGDVPPRWKIPGAGSERTVMKKPRGVALDPKHKEVIVSDMRLNAVLTYYFPEIF